MMSVACADAPASLQLDAPKSRFGPASNPLLMVYPSIAIFVLLGSANSHSRDGILAAAAVLIVLIAAMQSVPHPARPVEATGQMR